MALQVWLPLDGDLHNQGVSALKFSNLNANNTKIDNSGKIGKCYFNNSFTAGGLVSNSKISLGTNQSMFCWVNFSSLNNNSSLGAGLVALHRYGNSTGMGLNIKYVSSTTGYITVSTGTGSSRTYNEYCGTTLMLAGTWYHVGYTYNGSTIKLYVNGVCEKTQSYSGMSVPSDYLMVFCWSFENVANSSTPHTNYKLNGKLNDVRIYDHCLSEDEIHELSLGKVVHYPMNEDLPNLFLNSEFHLSSSDLAVTSSTDWTKYVRYYNGSPSLHSFANGEDTINLGSSGNIGISFLRKATDINLDTSSLYTISCEAKCSKPNATLDIGLSYYNSSNSWVWRGGTNPQAFTATNTWQKFTLTFTPDADTQYISYCFTVIGASGHTFTLRKCKLEKGTIASKWIPVGDSKIHDISGLHNDLTNSGIITFTVGSPRYNRCLQFNGSNYLSCTSPTAEVKTLSLWAYIGSIPTSSSVLFADYKSKLSIGFYNSGTLIITRCAGTSATLGTISSLVKTNSWNHFCVVNGATNQLYINGLAATMSGSNNWTHNTDVLMIGNRDYNNGSGFTNKISDVRLYATALSADDVLKLYKLGNV